MLSISQVVYSLYGWSLQTPQRTHRTMLITSQWCFDPRIDLHTSIPPLGAWKHAVRKAILFISDLASRFWGEVFFVVGGRGFLWLLPLGTYVCLPVHSFFVAFVYKTESVKGHMRAYPAVGGFFFSKSFLHTFGAFPESAYAFVFHVSFYITE